jgi:hypothetical protein
MSLPKISHVVKTVTVSSSQQIIYMTFKLIKRKYTVQKQNPTSIKISLGFEWDSGQRQTAK